jgi:uracil phosphoribosyltransferase
VREKLTRLRDETTPPKIFRELVAEIATLLLYEATADLPTDDREIRTPLASYKGARLRDKVGLIPVLRAGIGMVEAALELMPEAQVWHIGLFRDERTLRPIEYYNKLPSSATVQICLVLDPMLATGGSATATIDVLKKWGAKRIKYVGIIAAPEGVRALVSAHPDVPIHVAALDERLNEKGYIVPGLGDAGDRQFGTG